nr:hypothetical protein [Tanacetum cinerariifolium]
MDQTILKSHVEKPEKFKRSDFRCWHQNMLFYLTSFHVSYVLTDSKPVDPYMVDGQNVPIEAQMTDYERAASQWNHNEYNCRNYILNALDDSLYDIYSTFATAREIWESLEKKYKTQVACSKKFIAEKFLNFKMNDAKPVVKQVEELQIIIHEMELEGSNRMNEQADANSIEPNANMVGESSSKSKLNHKNKGKNGGSGQKYSKDGKKDYTQQKNNYFKKVYHCWVYRKPRHKAKDCRHKKEYGGGNSGGNSNQANHVESPKEFAGVIESFLTINVVDWWLDTSATKHIWNSSVSCQKVNASEPMFMGNETASKIERKGKVILKLTFGKDLGYLDEGLFKLSVVTDDNVINNDNAGTSTASVYTIDPSNLWHSRLSHTYKVEVENQLDKKIKTLRTDRGGEHESNDFFEFCSTFGIVHQTTAPYTPQQNGVAEPKNSAAYRFLVYKFNVKDISNNTIIESAEADLFENIFPYKDKKKQISNPRKRVMNDQLSQDEADNNSEVPQENVEPRRSFVVFVCPKASLDVCSRQDESRRDHGWFNNADPLLYRGEYSQWRERFMNYLEEQTDDQAMISSIQNGDQPLPVIAQVSLVGNAHNAPPTLKDLKFWTAEEKKTQKINRLDAFERQMRGSEYDEQDRKAAILYEYETFKAIEGEQFFDAYL